MKTDKIQLAYRIGMANTILDSFLPGVVLSMDRELRMSWDNRKQPPRYNFPARLRTQGDLPEFGYRQRPCGGTGMQALAQLIRYVRDLPRLPMVTWEYWAGDRVKLCERRTIILLNAAGYGNTLKTCCVLCGDPDFKRGLDWWSLDKVTGPSCQNGVCREEVAKPA